MCQDPELFDERDMTVIILFLNSTVQSLEGSDFWITQNPGLEFGLFFQAHVLCVVVGWDFFGAVRNSSGCLGFGSHDVRACDHD